MSGPKSSSVTVNNVLLDQTQAFQRACRQLNAALEAHIQMQEHLPGLVLPAPPELPTLDTTDVPKIREATARVTQLARDYQREVDSALMNYHQQKRMGESMREWGLQFQARATRTARDVVAALEPAALFVANRQKKIGLPNMVAEALKLVNAGSKEAEGELSDDTFSALTALLVAENANEALIAVETLRARLDEDRVAEQRKREKCEQRTQKETMVQVAAEIADALEDLGYRVSGIEDTAFVQHGNIYAWRKEWPHHALHMEFTPNRNDVRFIPLRMENEQISEVSEADTIYQRKQDTEFDKTWCSSNGIGKVQNMMRKRGIDLCFINKSKPGAVELKSVPEKVLGDKLQQVRKAILEEEKLKARSR